MGEVRELALDEGTRIAWREDGAGEPLLLVHGITEDHRTWDSFVPALAERHRVLRIDLPGHGASSALPAYSAFSLGQATAGFVRALGIEPPRVIGHSLGGIVATMLAALAPVRSVFNVDQSLRLGSFIEVVRGIAPRLTGAGFSDAMNEEMDLLGGPRLPAAVREELRRYRVPERQPVVAGLWLPLLDQDEEQVLATLMPVLAGIRVPYLSLHGADPGPGYGAWLASAIPGAVTEVWDGLGHWLHRVEPERFLARVRAFHGDAA
jgi:pimeloyl-ACP methyl ester carboxylesterase